MNGVLNLGWWAALGGVKLLRVFVVCTFFVTLWWHCGCGGGKMKWVVKKMVGNEGEAGRLTVVSNQLLRYRSHIK